MNRKASPKATSKGLATLIIVVIVTACTLITIVPADRSGQATNSGIVTREGSPPTTTYWSKTYGGSATDIAWDIQNSSDGGYIVAGETNSTGAGQADVWVLKLDSAGSVTWQKAYGGASDDVAYSVEQTSDGGYVVAGYTYSFGSGQCDAWVIKLDSAGLVTWQKTYGGTSQDWAMCIRQTSDGGYVVAGETFSFGAGSGDLWVLKLDSTGLITWQRTYGGTSLDYAWCIQQTSDGGYVVTGATSSFGAGNYDIWVLKLDSTGLITWQKTYGGADYDEAEWIQQTSDSGYIVGGVTRSFGAGSWDAWVLKLDTTGSVSWQKTYGGAASDVANSVEQTQDGGYIVCGETNSSGAGAYDVLILKLTSTGSVTWQRTYGGSGNDEAMCGLQTADNGYALAGFTGSFGPSKHNFWVIKLGSGGGVAWDANSHASTGTTSFTPMDSNAFASPTSVTPGSSTATVTDTHVTPQDTAATVTVQSTPATVLTYLATFTESGLVAGTGWSVRLNDTTMSSSSATIDFGGLWNGVYSFTVCNVSGNAPSPANESVTVATPSSGAFTVNGANVNQAVVFQYTVTRWDPVKNSYPMKNPSSIWSSEGNCYGFSSTAILYFLHYTLGDNTYPYFPSQYPNAAWTSDLQYNGLYDSEGEQITINNMSLAVMLHQVYDPQNRFNAILNNMFSNEKHQFQNLLGNLTKGVPVVLLMHTSKYNQYHAVVAWGAGTIGNGINAGNVTIYLYDPNFQKTTSEAIYNPATGSFSYNHSDWYDYYGGFYQFHVISPTMPDKSWMNPLNSLQRGWNNFLSLFSSTPYWLVFVDRMVTISSNGLKDYFTTLGDSRSFVCGIPGSSGVEEGSMQFYAIPSGTPFTIDPSSDQSAILIARVRNESGQLVGHGYLLNLTTPLGMLNYTLTPSGSGFSLSSGATPIDLDVTFFSANQESHSIFRAFGIPVPPALTANFTVTDWGILNSTSQPSVRLQMGGISYGLTNGQNGLPHTGAWGTTWILLVGGASIVVVIAIIAIRKRRRAPMGGI